MSGSTPSGEDAIALRVGDVVGGKFLVEKPLGRGGMGVVFAARHVTLGHRVALKAMSRSASPDALARFMREGQAMAALDDEHVARVLDFGTEAGTPYLVMEMLEGRDLRAEVRARGPLPVEEAADLVVQACCGIAHAHERGVVHRDVKPSNLFLVRRGERTVVKVLDFGISKLVKTSDDDASLTQTSSMLGSPAYASPEQIRDAKNVDARTDVWSLGVVLFYLLTNTLPFRGEGYSGVCAAIVADPVPSITTLRTGLPAAIEAVVARCLDKNRDARYPRAIDLARALVPFSPKSARWLEGFAPQVDAPPIDAAAPVVAHDALAEPDTEGASVMRSDASTKKSRARVWGVAAVVSLLAVVGVRALATRDVHAPKTAAPTTASATIAPLAAPTPTPTPTAGPIVTPSTAETPTHVAASTSSHTASSASAKAHATTSKKMPATSTTKGAPATVSTEFGGAALGDHT